MYLLRLLVRRLEDAARVAVFLRISSRDLTSGINSRDPYVPEDAARVAGAAARLRKRPRSCSCSSCCSSRCRGRWAKAPVPAAAPAAAAAAATRATRGAAGEQLGAL